MIVGEHEPLGIYRLSLTKLILLILKMNKEELGDELLDNDIFKSLSGLIKKHPWNNFFQLRIMAIYEEILENSKNVQFREKVLKSAGIIETILEIQGTTNFSFASERQIRHGYMGMTIKISNTLQISAQNQEVADHLDQVGESWSSYVNGDLQLRNEVNNKKLGGQEPRQ